MPIVSRLMRRHPKRMFEGKVPPVDEWKGLEALIVSPSQELAMQIVRAARSLLPLDARPAVQQLIGGANPSKQRHSLKKCKPLVGVGTPGRIAKLLYCNSIPVKHLNTIVLDEADTLADMEDTREMLTWIAARHFGPTKQRDAMKRPFDVLVDMRRKLKQERRGQRDRSLEEQTEKALREAEERCRADGVPFNAQVRGQAVKQDKMKFQREDCQSEKATVVLPEPVPLPQQMVLVGATMQRATVESLGKWAERPILPVSAPAQRDGDAGGSGGGGDAGGSGGGLGAALGKQQQQDSGARVAADEPAAAAPSPVMLPHNLNHAYLRLSPRVGVPRQGTGRPSSRHSALMRLLVAHRHRARRVLAFVSTAEEVMQVHEKMRDWVKQRGSEEWTVAALHGDMTSQARQAAVAAMMSQGPEKRVLIASDLAALGLDLPQVNLVVQLSGSTAGWQQYIHRAGRAGRMGAKGVVLSVVDGTEVGSLLAIAKRLNLFIQEVELNGGKLVRKKEKQSEGKD